MCLRDAECLSKNGSGCLLFCLLVGLALGSLASPGQAQDPEQGYRYLTEKAYLSPDFDEEVLANIWRVWPEPLRSTAAQSTSTQRRQMAFSRYGFTPRPGQTWEGEAPVLPLQYVVNASGKWTMNCFSCHGGQILGETIPGLPNNRYALQTLSDEMRTIKLEMERPLARMDLGSTVIPLGTTRGTTNAVVFGIGLMSQRDAELNVVANPFVPRFVHHDLDPPPWWHYRKKSHIYIDGYAEKGHRALMQFMLVRSNGPEKFREWESDFLDVKAYLESLRPPKYPFAVDENLARQGEEIFQRNCAECHGTYGENEFYPNRIVPIDEIGTDPVRLQAIPAEGRQRYGESWFGHFGKQETRSDTNGYMAPPLDGIWATAPYLHNGSVPTLWHLFHPEQRPVVWKRTSETGYDQQRIGLEIEELNDLPPAPLSNSARREYFDTRKFGKSAAGHLYPEALTPDEKLAVLEYLKTL